MLPAVDLLSPFSLVLCFVTDSRMFWVFGSLFQRRCGAPLACCCGSGNVLQTLRRLFRQLLRQRPSTSQWVPITSTGLSLSLTLPGELHHLSSPACHVQTAGITFQLSP